jgi:nucleoside diphosphate kinase
MAASLAATAAPPGEGEYAFGCEFLDPITNNLRQFNIAVWEKDASVEVYDPKVQRTVLKRCVPFETVGIDDFVINNTVTVMGRSYLIKSYLSAATRARFTTLRENAICLVKPDALPHMGTLVTELLDSGFDIGAMKLCKLSAEEAAEFLESKRGTATFAESVRFLASDAVLAVLVTAENAVSKLQGVAGPANPADAAEALPDSIRCVPCPLCALAASLSLSLSLSLCVCMAVRISSACDPLCLP